MLVFLTFKHSDDTNTSCAYLQCLKIIDSFIKQFENEANACLTFGIGRSVLSASPGLGQNKHVPLTLNMHEERISADWI